MIRPSIRIKIYNCLFKHLEFKIIKNLYFINQYDIDIIGSIYFNNKYKEKIKERTSKHQAYELFEELWKSINDYIGLREDKFDINHFFDNINNFILNEQYEKIINFIIFICKRFCNKYNREMFLKSINSILQEDGINILYKNGQYKYTINFKKIIIYKFNVIKQNFKNFYKNIVLVIFSILLFCVSCIFIKSQILFVPIFIISFILLLIGLTIKNPNIMEIFDKIKSLFPKQ